MLIFNNDDCWRCLNEISVDFAEAVKEKDIDRMQTDLTMLIAACEQLNEWYEEVK